MCLHVVGDRERKHNKPVDSRTVIAGIQLREEKEEIIWELEHQSTIWGIATELAIQAGEGKKKVKIPTMYKCFE